MRYLLWLCCVCTLLADSAQATSFTAASRNSLEAGGLTVMVVPGSPDAVITVPASTFDGYPWPPPVAVTFYTAAATYADCNHPSQKSYTDDAGVQWWPREGLTELLGYCTRG